MPTAADGQTVWFGGCGGLSGCGWRKRHDDLRRHQVRRPTTIGKCWHSGFRANRRRRRRRWRRSAKYTTDVRDAREPESGSSSSLCGQE
jgi:hypothetical protein